MVVIDGVNLDEEYVVKIPYNGTGETGGDPMVDNLNIWYEVWLILVVALLSCGRLGLTLRCRAAISPG